MVRKQSQLVSALRCGYASASSGARPLVIVETREGTVAAASLNAIAAAKQLNDKPAFLVSAASADAAKSVIDSLQQYGPSNIYVAAHASFAQPPVAEAAAPFIVAAVKQANASHVVAAHSAYGKNVLPRAAAVLDVAQVSDVLSVVDADTFTRPIYAGNAICKVKSRDSVKFVTIRPTSFEAATAGQAAGAPVEEVKAEVSGQAGEFIKEEIVKSDRPELGAARVVVGGGRGMKNGENFKILYDLADKLGGTVGASRAAVDAGYVDNSLQIGQTGKVIAPELYIAVGISGAIQHLAGMKDSKTIVAINKDADAPIFQIADYGLVADLFEAVPELTKKL
ncbi:Electron transfer flavoprotein alpha-subunit [Sorochytrium milnesiophthora]